MYLPPVSPMTMYESPKDGVITIKRAFAAPTAGTNTDIVAAVTGKKIRVISAILTPGDFATNAIAAFCTGGTTTVIANIHLVAATSNGVYLNRNDAGWFETNTGEKLNVAAGGNALNCQITYVELTP